MEKPQPINMNGDIVYNGEDVYKYDKAFFIGCARVRLIIEKKKINDCDYFFAYKKGDKWIKSTANYPRAKLYLREEYVINNIPKFMDTIKQELYKYPEAPEILELEEHEKFKDRNGKSIKIEVRGTRDCKNCFFRVKDVSEGFNIPNLHKTITDTRYNGYIENENYKYFSICEKNGQPVNDKDRIIKVLYLTYEGILRVLFTSFSPDVKLFISWATEKLFTIQLGTEEQKDGLAAELIGVNSETIKNVFRTNTSKTPCVYLYLIGKAIDLLEGNYNTDDLLCKYGCTNDLPRRCKEHEKTFKNEFNVNIEMLYFSIIEAKYIFDAEKNITQFFKGNLIEYEKMKELIIINKKDLPQIRQHYTMIQNSYIGRYEEMNNRVVLLEKEIIQLNNNIYILNEKHKNELLEKNIETIQEKHKKELLEKEIELLKIKLQILTEK